MIILHYDVLRGPGTCIFWFPRDHNIYHYATPPKLGPNNIISGNNMQLFPDWPLLMDSHKSTQHKIILNYCITYLQLLVTTEEC